MNLCPQKLKLLKQLAFAGIVTAAIAAFAAQRRVTILAASDSSSNKVVTLFNGSSTPVNYTVTCYSNGTVRYSNVAQTLTSKATKTYGLAGGCAGWVSTALTNGGASCSNGTGYTYANRSSACASGYTVCNFAEANNANPGSGYYSGWVELDAPYNNSASGSFEVSDWSGSFSGSQNYSGSIAFFNSSGQNKCRPNGGGTVINNCGTYGEDWTTQVLCCPTASSSATIGPIDNCEVSINSSESGYLQSPQFKGNTPF